MNAVTLTTSEATVVVAIISTISVVASSIITSWLGRRREKADIDSVAVDTAERAVRLVRNEMERMAATIADQAQRITEQAHEIRELRAQVYALQEMVRALGGDPRAAEWPL